MFLNKMYKGKVLGETIGCEELDYVYGNLVVEQETEKYFIVDLSHFDKDTKFIDIAIEINPETVGQYTGLKDKNGKRIFGGDIVKCYDEMFRKTFVGEVVYRSGSFCIKETEDDYLYHFRWDDYECEIIGNVHDDHTSLKGA